MEADARRLQELRAGCGAQAVLFSFGRSKHAAGEAYRKVFDKTKFTSAWRFAQVPHGAGPDEAQEWLVAVLAEKEEEITKAKRLMREEGGIERSFDQLDDADLLTKLRERRWALVMDDAAHEITTGERRTHTKTHAPMGVRIERGGQMRPHRRPQG